MRNWRLGAVALLGLVSSPMAQAGIYTDDLTKCVVRSTSGGDQVAFMRWMFAALSTNPSLSDLASVKPQQTDELTRTVAGLMERLMLKDCRSEMVSALKYEGGGAIGAAFNTLGNVAARNLMTNPATMAEMAKLQQYSDVSAFNELAREAGLPVDTPSSAKTTPPAK
jgi:hypothetical protein